jgi:hypothetical protein
MVVAYRFAEVRRQIVFLLKTAEVFIRTTWTSDYARRANGSLIIPQHGVIPRVQKKVVSTSVN